MNSSDKPDEKEAAPASVVCTEDDDASSVRSDISSSMMKLDPAELSYKSVLLSDEVVEKWNFCLWQGAGTEKRKELLMKYPSAENCGYLVPPEMNSEVALLLPKAINRQDKCLIRLQNLLASGLTALGISLNIFLEDSNYNKEIYANLTDAGQIFADAFNRVTCQRRAQAVLYVNLTCSKNKPRETNEMLLFAPPINIFGTKRALVPPVPQQNQRSRTAVSNANKAYQRRNRGSQRSTRGNVQHPRTTQGVMTHMRTKRLNQNMPVMQQQQPLPQQFRQPPAGPSGVTAPGLLSWKDYKKMKEKANQFDRKGKQQQQQQQQQQANRPNPWMYQ